MARSPRPRSRREALRLGAAALSAAALAPLLAACGGGEERPVATAPPGTALRLRTSGPGQPGASGGVLRLGALAGAGAPAGASAEALDALERPLISGQLVAVDPRPAALYGDLAERVEIADAVTVIFSLREGLRFHPDANGLAAPLTADDVRRDFDARAAAGEHLFTAVVARVDAPDPRTVVLHLLGPFSLLFESLADPAQAAVRSSETSAVTSLRLGSGPFVPARREDAGDVLAANPLYHRGGLPLLSRIEVTPAAGSRDLAAAFGRGDLDLLAGAPSTAGEADAASGVEGARTVSRPGFGLVGLGLSLVPEKGGRPVRWLRAFQDARVRRAVSAALDRDAISAATGGAVSGPVGPAHEADALPAAELGAHALYAHDPADARRLLDAAGELALEFRIQVSSRQRDLAQAIEAQLRDAGMAPRLQLLDREDWERAFHAGDFEATLFELEGLRTPDVGLRLHTATGAGGGFSPWGFSSPRYDAAVREALSSVEPAVRAERSRAAQRLLLDGVPAMFPLVAPLEHANLSARLRGYEFDAYGFNEGWLSARWFVTGAAQG